MTERMNIEKIIKTKGYKATEGTYDDGRTWIEMEINNAFINIDFDAEGNIIDITGCSGTDY